MLSMTTCRGVPGCQRSTWLQWNDAWRGAKDNEQSLRYPPEHRRPRQREEPGDIPRDSVAEGERVLHDERLKYEAGRSVINFVLDAESALLTSQSLLSQAERSVTTAALALDLSVGRIDVDRLPGR